MSRLLLGAVLLAALAVAAARRLRRRRRPAIRRPGTDPGQAIPVRSYTSMDHHIARQRCSCGAHLMSKGESSHEHEGRPLRMVRLECPRCEAEEWIYFDTSRVPH